MKKVLVLLLSLACVLVPLFALPAAAEANRLFILCLSEVRSKRTL